MPQCLNFCDAWTELAEAKRVIRGLIKHEFNPATAPYRLDPEHYQLWLDAVDLVAVKKCE